MEMRTRTSLRLQSPILVRICALTLLFVGLPTFAAPASRSEAEALTKALVELGSGYQRAGADRRMALLPGLTRSAAERHSVLEELIRHRPGDVLRVALPSERIQELPEKVRAHLEQRVVLRGVLNVRYEDGPISARIVHSLEKNGQYHPLYFQHQPSSALHSGTRVELRGVLLPVTDGRSGPVAVESQDSVLTLDAGSGADGGSNGGAPGQLANTVGEQSTLVLLVNFRNDPTNRPWTLAQAEGLVFGQVSSFLLENSYNQTWLSGAVHGWYTIDHDNTVWNADDIAAKANAAAAADGVNVAAYTRVLYAFPRNAGASFSGSGTVGGIPSKAWFNGKFDLAVVGHELGHNFGLQHAHALECGESAVGTNCVSYEYGDHLDIMGNVNAGHYNAFEKTMLGWIGYGNSPTLTTVQGTGAYALATYELGGTGSRALRIPKSVDPVTGIQTWYYLEYRQPIGADAFLGNGSIPQGLTFHTGTDGDTRSSYQLDLTPASNANAFYDWDDTALVAGRSYSDVAAGVTITALSSGSGEAWLDVAFGAATCVHANPSVNVLPQQSEWLPAGSTATFELTLSNRDGAACAASTFDLSAVVPSGWSYTYSDPSLSISPGTSVTTSLTVTSPAVAVDGFYDIPMTARSLSDTSLVATDSVTYVVSGAGSGGVNAAPVAVNDSVALASVAPTVINVRSNDYDADADLLTVVSVTQGGKGSVSIRADGSLYYQPGKGFKGSDTFAYTISDGAATASATVSISLQASSGGGGSRPGAKR